MSNPTVQEYLDRIEQIDQIARHTLAQHDKRIPEKYSNIQATLKLLTNLITNFRKKSEAYELQLKSRAKIDDLIDQISFHKSRIVECEQMSATLMHKITERRQSIQLQEVRVAELRKNTIELKTDNVKKVLQLERLERQESNILGKENLEQRKQQWKIKTQYNRQFYREINRQKHRNMEIDALIKQKQELTTAIYRHLDQKIRIDNFLEELLQVTKGKLCHNERKSNLNGLNGSLMFKIIQNNKPSLAKTQLDTKLIIYDVLKSKYRTHIKNEKNNLSQPIVTQQQFMAYTPLQILGMIELKGGINNLRQKMAKVQSRQSTFSQDSQKSINLSITADL